MSVLQSVLATCDEQGCTAVVLLGQVPLRQAIATIRAAGWSVTSGHHRVRDYGALCPVHRRRYTRRQP